MARTTSAVPNPNGCLYCGVDRLKHLQRHAQGVGWHGWTEPTDALRKKRMLARRDTAARPQRRVDPSRAQQV